MLLRLSLAIGLMAAGTLTASAQTATESWRLGGLKMPESVIFDTTNNRLIVGNMVTFGPDGGADGYLSIVSPEGKLMSADLRAAVGELPASQRTALQLTKIEALSLAEASARSGMSMGALKVATHRAVQSLRRKFGLEP